MRGLLAHSWNFVNTEYATNAVQNGPGLLAARLSLRRGRATRCRCRTSPARCSSSCSTRSRSGLSFKAEYFNIGADYNANFGARREADVLLTDGIIGGGFINGGQLPTLNVANEFVDFDEPWYESIIGWHGATGARRVREGPRRSSPASTRTSTTTPTSRAGTSTPSTRTSSTPTASPTRSRSPRTATTRTCTTAAATRARSTRSSRTGTPRSPRSAPTCSCPGCEKLTLRTKLKYVHDVDFRKLENPNDTYVGQEPAWRSPSSATSSRTSSRAPSATSSVLGREEPRRVADPGLLRLPDPPARRPRGRHLQLRRGELRLRPRVLPQGPVPADPGRVRSAVARLPLEGVPGGRLVMRHMYRRVLTLGAASLLLGGCGLEGVFNLYGGDQYTQPVEHDPRRDLVHQADVHGARRGGERDPAVRARACRTASTRCS